MFISCFEQDIYMFMCKARCHDVTCDQPVYVGKTVLVVYVPSIFSFCDEHYWLCPFVLLECLLGSKWTSYLVMALSSNKIRCQVAI